MQANVEQHPQKNPFLMRPKSESQDLSILATVRTIPRLGEIKAQTLLQAFHSKWTIFPAILEHITELLIYYFKSPNSLRDIEQTKIITLV